VLPLALLLALSCGQSPQHRLFRQPNLSHGVSPSAFEINGQATPLALQCTTQPLYTELPRQLVTVARSSSAYCERSDGRLVLLGSNVARRERMGLRIESSGVNLIGASGDRARDLTLSGWTASNMTCTKTATGADGVANSASRCTATASNATISYAVTVASSKRSSSMYLRRVTGSGAIDVTRNAFTNVTNVSGSLSTSAWKRVWADCGGRGSDTSFSTIDNCIAATNMTSTLLNPTVGVRLATSGDVVEIDMVQDEASDYPTSPMAGFDRTIEEPSVASLALLPTTQGEVSVDWVSQRGSGADPAGNFPVMIASGTIAAAQQSVLLWVATDTGGLGAYVRNAVGLTTVGPNTSYGLRAGRGRNHRVAFGGTTTSQVFFDGLGAARSTTANVPTTTHTGPYKLGGFASDDTSQLGGWLTRVRWRSGAVGTFTGSELAVVLVGDSVVEASNNQVTEGNYPEQVLQAGIGGRRYDRYVTNSGTSGLTIDQCNTVARGYIDEAILYGAQSKRVIVFQCGTNSSGDGAPSVWGKMQTLFNDSIDAGVRILPATITPYSTNAAFISAVNASMASWSSTTGYRYANTHGAMESSPGSGVLSPSMDFGDGLHVNSLGASTEATVWLNAGRDAGFW
jgi:hypothetical protein